MNPNLKVIKPHGFKIHNFLKGSSVTFNAQDKVWIKIRNVTEQISLNILWMIYDACK